MKTKIEVYAKAFNRKTGVQVGEERKEVIDTKENKLFDSCKTILDIKNAYEDFWNELNSYIEEIVFVQRIVA